MILSRDKEAKRKGCGWRSRSSPHRQVSDGFCHVSLACRDHALLAGTVEGLFGFCMLTMSWNLLCRVSNAAGICISHLEWREDALGVFFAHMKNDQTGERPRDPRHVYANPLMPDICPILALGIYLLCCPTKSGHLFPGKNQDDRYSKLIKRLFLAHPEKMTEFGITANVSVQILKQD